MADRRALIVVSNRGPVSYARDADGRRVERRGGGGLATALRSIVDRHDVTWIANAMTDEDRVVAGEAQGGTILLAQDPDEYARYYNVIANPTLWFAQHCCGTSAARPTGTTRAMLRGIPATCR